MLLFDAISFSISSSVCILRTPKRQSSFNLPLNRMPPRILFSIELPSISLAIPIRLEKNGLASLPPPKLPNKSLLSTKNCLLSGKPISKRVRFVTTLSTSTFEKSGLMVTSKFKPLPIAILASPPTLKLEPLSSASKSFSVIAFT